MSINKAAALATNARWGGTSPAQELSHLPLAAHGQGEQLHLSELGFGAEGSHAFNGPEELFKESRI